MWRRPRDQLLKSFREAYTTFANPSDTGVQTSDRGQDERLIYGVSAMQGWRISMEDSHTTVLDLLGKGEPSKAHPQKLSFFGVYDGHGGDKVALFAGDNIHKIIAKQDTFKAGNYEQALKDGFLATDRAILSGMSALPPEARDSVSAESSGYCCSRCEQRR
jgi:serine/threonine protein phosphatase PrpC